MELNTSAAAERNKQPIAEELLRLLPPSASVLEIASGTGQHVAHFAQLFTGIRWQPTDRADTDLVQLEARRRATGLENVLPALRLDVLHQPWPLAGVFDAVLCINMIHISPWETTAALFSGAAQFTSPGSGLAILYGPFREGGRHIAPSNVEFERWLQAKDPRFGVRNLEDVEDIARQHDFARVHLARMPANNLLLAFRRL